jgi:hypothetical protein
MVISRQCYTREALTLYGKPFKIRMLNQMPLIETLTSSIIGIFHL